jgi:hypothetical protein
MQGPAMSAKIAKRTFTITIEDEARGLSVIDASDIKWAICNLSALSEDVKTEVVETTNKPWEPTDP